MAGALLPGVVLAHAFDERHDLPAPLRYFVLGAAATVFLSFVVIALASWWKPGDDETAATPSGLNLPLGPLLPLLARVLPPCSVLLFALTVAAALLGTGNPMMNLAPTMVWIAWWAGGSLAVAGLGNFWPAIDPWRAMHMLLDAIARRLGRPQGATLGLAWPACLGEWPAVALLLLWGAGEVVFPLAAAPYRIGVAALAWTVFTLAGMVLFGREPWQRHGDVFAIYFAMLGRFGPLAPGADGRSLLLRPYGGALIGAVSPSVAAFIVAMLAIVLFDGLLAGETWSRLEPALRSRFPGVLDANGYVAGSLGLLLVWAAFLLSFLLVCGLSARLGARSAGSGAVAGQFAPTLVPIAVAYGVAHNFSSLLVQGQNLVPLISDPLGAGWNLLGTAGFRPNTSIIDAGTTWYVAIGAIVIGHVMSMGLAHRSALRLCRQPRKAVLASLPLTLLMVVFTALSLLIIAEPMVRFDAVPTSASPPSR